MRNFIAAFFILTCFLHGTSSAQVKENKDYEYQVGFNDLLEIKVYEEPDLTKTVRVGADGAISYPLLGNILVKGLTPKEIEEKITELLGRDYLINPQVSVFIKEHSKISVLGQVRLPGAYELKAGLTVLDAIALAGGFTEKSNPAEVKLVRTEGKDKETINIDATEIIEQGDREKNLLLAPGDLIIVGELSETSSYVVVLGQVKAPGRYIYKKGMAVVDAIALAGGLTETAAGNGTKVIRIKDGKKTVYPVPLSSILAGAGQDKNIALSPNDTIVVPESFF